MFTSGYVNTETILHFFNEACSRNWIWLDKFISYIMINVERQRSTAVARKLEWNGTKDGLKILAV